MARMLRAELDMAAIRNWMCCAADGKVSRFEAVVKTMGWSRTYFAVYCMNGCWSIIGRIRAGGPFEAFIVKVLQSSSNAKFSNGDWRGGTG